MYLAVTPFLSAVPGPADSVEFRRLTERHHRPCGVRPSAPACRPTARQRQYYAHINLQRVWPAAHGTPTTGRSGQSAGGDGPDDSGRRGTESSVVYVRGNRWYSSGTPQGSRVSWLCESGVSRVLGRWFSGYRGSKGHGFRGSWVRLSRGRLQTQPKRGEMKCTTTQRRQAVSSQSLVTVLPPSAPPPSPRPPPGPSPAEPVDPDLNP